MQIVSEETSPPCGTFQMNICIGIDETDVKLNEIDLNVKKF